MVVIVNANLVLENGILFDFILTPFTFFFNIKTKRARKFSVPEFFIQWFLLLPQDIF
jgi:hypothetical protein